MDTQYIRFQSGPFELAGQLDIPDSPKGVLLLVPGTGRHDRHGNIKGYPAYNNLYDKIAEVVLDANYAIFRYDKGGTGESSSGLNDMRDIIAAYESMINCVPNIKNYGIICHGAGVGQLYRAWFEITQLKLPNKLILIGSGINRQRTTIFKQSILLITSNDERGWRSKAVLEDYTELTGNPHEIVLLDGVNDYLCGNANASLFRENGCIMPEELFTAINHWLQQGY